MLKETWTREEVLVLIEEALGMELSSACKVNYYRYKEHKERFLKEKGLI